MKLPLHKKVDRIIIHQTPDSYPYWIIKLKEFDWMKDTIIRLEKENEELKEYRRKWNG